MAFEASQLLTLRAKAEKFWSDAHFNNQYTSQAEGLKAIMQNQTATFRELKDSGKKNKIGITWINPCDITVQDCTPDCTITGAELDSEIQEYDILGCKEVTFSINETTLESNDYTLEEVYAKGEARALQVLDEYLAQQTLIKLATFKGLNVAPSPFTNNSTLKTTEVPEEQFRLNYLTAHLFKQAQLNQLSNPYYINNGSLSIDYINAQLDKTNMNGSGDFNRSNLLNMTFDHVNFLKASVPDDLFVVDSSAVAFVTKAKNPTTPTRKVNTIIYQIPSKALAGVFYDVFYQEVCETNEGETEYKHSWKFKVRWDLFLNPEACPITLGGQTYTPKGLYSYTAKATPAG